MCLGRNHPRRLGSANDARSSSAGVLPRESDQPDTCRREAANGLERLRWYARLKSQPQRAEPSADVQCDLTEPTSSDDPTYVWPRQLAHHSVALIHSKPDPVHHELNRDAPRPPIPRPHVEHSPCACASQKHFFVRQLRFAGSSEPTYDELALHDGRIPWIRGAGQRRQNRTEGKHRLP